MRERVRDAGRSPRGEAARNRRGPGRGVLDLHAVAALPRADELRLVGPCGKRYGLPPGVVVVYARLGRLRVREVHPAHAAACGEARQLAEGEVVGVERYGKGVVAANIDRDRPAFRHRDEELRRGAWRGRAQLRRRKKRHDLAPDDEVAGAGAGHGDAQDGHAVRRLRIRKRPVCRAGVEDVLKDGVGGAGGA